MTDGNYSYLSAIFQDTMIMNTVSNFKTSSVITYSLLTLK